MLSRHTLVSQDLHNLDLTSHDEVRSTASPCRHIHATRGFDRVGKAGCGPWLAWAGSLNLEPAASPRRLMCLADPMEGETSHASISSKCAQAFRCLGRWRPPPPLCICVG